MNKILFYKRENGESPIEDFLDALNTKQALKVTWVLNLIEEHDIVPITYFKKLVNTDDIWEVRVQCGNDKFRFLCFKYENRIIVLTNGFQKKTQKTPKSEIILAEKRKSEWLRRMK
ncbi:MAG: hypothetical protein CSA42_08385 [Gammaproteobacteria bacterium]|nr:MAG: hypothetical protein CSA42_08385 [Gammaproteobacteria bacterium]